MIIRIQKRSNPFVQIDKTCLDDGALSFKAKGILAFLLSKPDGWTTSAEALSNVGPDGRDATLSGLKELEESGYLEREKSKDENGRWVWDQTVYEVPIHSRENRLRKSPPHRDKDLEINTISTDVEIVAPPANISPSKRAEEIVVPHLEKIAKMVNEGSGFDILRVFDQLWDVAQREGAEQEINSVLVGTQVCRFFFQYQTDREPTGTEWGMIGRLVKSHGKAALYGIEAAINRGIDLGEDPNGWFKYARVAARGEQEKAEAVARAVSDGF